MTHSKTCPEGAITTVEEIDALLKQARTAPVTLHCVYWCRGGYILDQSTLDKRSRRRGNGTVEPIIDIGYRQLGIDHFLDPVDPNWLFTNYWFAYAYHLRMKESETA